MWNFRVVWKLLMDLLGVPGWSLFESSPDSSEDTSGKTFLWIAIACGSVINTIIGGYAGVMNILETEGRWTQRLEIVKDEFKWWIGMGSFVVIALLMAVVASAKGESVDATILILATEAGVVFFVYIIQGWLHSEFRQILWLAWTGKSRTGCGILDGAKVPDLITDFRDTGMKSEKTTRYESKVDYPGYCTAFSSKIKEDITTTLKHRNATGHKSAAEVFAYVGSDLSARKYVFPQLKEDQTKVSILWGGSECQVFSRRASRGITGYSLTRIRSSYSLINIDETKWMFVAGGIVARNKGLSPQSLICGMIEVKETIGATGDAIITYNRNGELMDEAETTSKWKPRQAKTSRSQYARESNDQFSGLGKPFCAAVVEIALLLHDIPNPLIIQALTANVEQQSSQKLWQIRDLAGGVVLQQAMYVCQYMTLCAKLNWYGNNNERPDLLMGMMYATWKGWNYTVGENEEEVIDILEEELRGLDLGTPQQSSFDILFCLGTYLGIAREDRKQVISGLSHKFSPGATIQTIFSENAKTSMDKAGLSRLDV